MLKELPGCLSVGFVHELGDGKLTCSVYTNKEIMKDADAGLIVLDVGSMAEGNRQSSSGSSVWRRNATIIPSTA